MPRISPGATAKLTPFDGVGSPRVVDDEVAHVEQRRRPADDRRSAAGCRRPLLGDVVHRELHVAPDHRARDLRRRRLRRLQPLDRLRPRRITVIVSRDLHHLVELVRDEDDRARRRSRSLPQHAPQLVDLRRRQHRGRLVEDQDLRAAIQRLEDLDALRFADRQVGDEPLRAARRSPVARLSSAHLAARRARGRAARRFVSSRPSIDVLGDGERRHEHEVLVHHADAGGDRVGGATSR